jgi:hypothetical protein
MRRGFWAHPAFPGALVSEVQEVYKSQGVDINDNTSSILGITPLPRGIDEVGLLDHEHPVPAHDGRVTGMPLIRAASLSRSS